MNIYDDLRPIKKPSLFTERVSINKPKGNYLLTTRSVFTSLPWVTITLYTP
ncbi:MAG: hypothetical protein RL705_2018, partial [Bacteroidota bacterium]